MSPYDFYANIFVVLSQQVMSIGDEKEQYRYLKISYRLLFLPALMVGINFHLIQKEI